MGFMESLRLELMAEFPDIGPVISEGSGHIPPQESLRGDLALIRKAVSLTPNTDEHFETREAHRDFGYAIKAALPDDPQEAFEIFAEWSARWTGGENDPGYVEAEWGRYKPPYRRGASYVYETAERASRGVFSRAEQWFEKNPTPPADFPGQNPITLFGGPDPKGKKRPLQLTPFREAAESALSLSTKPLVKGLLDQGAMTVLYGESNTGKTFVAMDLAWHIAAGRSWGGMKVTPMPTVYIAAEGGVGARKRAAAILAKYGEAAADVPFYYVLHPVDLLDPNADLGPLIEILKELEEELGPLGLVGVDTVSRAMAGGDENSSTDMGALVRHFDAIRAATGAHLLAVHHSGKDRAKGARGHSLLRAATDTEIEIADGQITVTKQRDLDKSFASGFVLEPVVLGVDEDGAPVSSCTVRLTGKASAVVVGVPNAAEADVLDAIKTLAALNPDGEPGVPVPEMVDFLSAKSTPQPYHTVRTHLRRLAEKSLVIRSGRGKWAVFEPDQIDPIGQPLVRGNSVLD
jgi:hypothetical protein